MANSAPPVGAGPGDGTLHLGSGRDRSGRSPSVRRSTFMEAATSYPTRPVDPPIEEPPSITGYDTDDIVRGAGY